MPKKYQALTLYSAGELTLRSSDDLEQAISSELGRGLVVSTRAEVNGTIARARINELGRTAHLAVAVVSDLSREEIHVARDVPHALPRVQVIVDTASRLITEELRRQGGR